MEDNYAIGTITAGVLLAKAGIAGKLVGAGVGAGALSNLGSRAAKKIKNFRYKVKAKRLVNSISKKLEDQDLDPKTRNELILSRELAKSHLDKNYSTLGASLATVGKSITLGNLALAGGGFIAGDILTDKILDTKKAKIKRLQKELDLYERRLKAVRSTEKTNKTKYHAQLKFDLVSKISEIKNKIINLKITK
jgi:hypothetical protein